MDRLGVDLDRVSFWKLLATYFTMKHYYGNVRVYKTKNGWHLEADCETSLEARYFLGDDKRRLELSEFRYWLTGELDDILFELKFDGKKWRKREHVTEEYLLNWHHVEVSKMWYCKCGRKLYKKPVHACECGRKWFWKFRSRRYVYGGGVE